MRVLAVPRSTAMSRPRAMEFDGTGVPSGRRTKVTRRGPSRDSGPARARLATGEEQAQLAHGGLGAAAAVDPVLGELDAQVTPDRPEGGVAGVRRAHHVPHDLPRVLRPF